MIRDNEIQRLVKYAQGLNTIIKFKEAKSLGEDAAEWTTDGSAITIYRTPSSSKLSIVLALIHELGHHLAHIHNNDRKVDPKLEEAIDNEVDKKIYRKRIYDWEVQGATWWETIYKDTDCKFNIDRLNQEKQYDLWQYEVYYSTGSYPTNKERKKKRKELRKNG